MPIRQFSSTGRPIDSPLLYRNPPGMSFAHASCDLLLQRRFILCLLFFEVVVVNLNCEYYATATASYGINLLCFSQPAWHELCPCFMRPVAAKSLDASLVFLFKVVVVNLNCEYYATATASYGINRLCFIATHAASLSAMLRATCCCKGALYCVFYFLK